jgi:hypothetical protein
VQDERTGLEKELDEMQNQLEDDIDSEIENMKRMYEDKLAVSRETTLKYKGKFLALRFLLLLLRLLGLCAALGSSKCTRTAGSCFLPIL